MNAHGPGELARHGRSRWPTTARLDAPPGPDDPNDIAAELERMHKVIGDLSGALAAMTPTILGSETFILDATGQASRQYRLPFRSLAVWSYSANQTVLTNSPPASAAPTSGPGMAIVAPKLFTVCNLAGYEWSLYNGVAGDLVVVEAFGMPQPPAAAKLA